MSTYRVRAIKGAALTEAEKFAASWLLVTPRYATIADKLNGMKYSNRADTTYVEKMVVVIYGKLGIGSRYELLDVAEEFNIHKPKGVLP